MISLISRLSLMSRSTSFCVCDSTAYCVIVCMWSCTRILGLSSNDHNWILGGICVGSSCEKQLIPSVSSLVSSRALYLLLSVFCHAILSPPSSCLYVVNYHVDDATYGCPVGDVFLKLWQHHQTHIHKYYCYIIGRTDSHFILFLTFRCPTALTSLPLRHTPTDVITTGPVLCTIHGGSSSGRVNNC